MRKKTKLKKIVYSRKSQQEIIGLAIIMVLISVGFLLFLSVYINGSQESYVNNYMNTELPILLNDVILDTHIVECRDLTLKDVIIECAEGNTFLCSNGNNSCQEGEAKLTEFLDKTLGSRLDNYRYYVYYGSDFTDNTTWLFGKVITSPEIIWPYRKGCYTNYRGRPRLLNSKPGVQPLPLRNGQRLYFKLDRCFE